MQNSSVIWWEIAVYSRTGKFNLIAPIYGLFFNFQVNYYRKVLAKVAGEIDIPKYKTIIDVGCGTAALCYVLNENGFQVTGIDVEHKMIKIAEKKLRGKTVSLMNANALEKLPFADKSFDVAISSYVVHGLKEADRMLLYKEMSRIARHIVVFHDYNENRAFLTNLIEWLEGGDYFNFIKNARTEMEASFTDIRTVQVDLRAAWYICTPVVAKQATRNFHAINRLKEKQPPPRG